MRRTLHFTGDSEVKIKEEPVPSPKKGQVLIDSIISSISHGSEKLVFRGELNEDIVLDKEIEALNHELQYPVKYGYSVIGEIVSTGKNVDENWIGRKVFAFHPHESEFVADLDDLIIVPDKIDCRNFVFLPNVETAVNLVLDGAPLIGENVMVIGQGIVGLLTTAILSKFPIANLITMDLLKSRREISKDLGADVVLDENFSTDGSTKLYKIPEEGLDLIFETSGNLSALEKAVENAGFEG
ncbi:MAG: zinc-binding alcohol dehydrogenase, partial [Candidatus Thermoplasmatota archaeon]